MRKVLLTAFIGMMTLGLQAQEGNWCASDQHLQDLLNANPEIRAQYEQLREQHYEMARSGSANRNGEKIIVPTVVHVLWNNCESNISTAQVMDGMRILNEDLQRRNADSADTRETFKPYAAGANVEFRLVKEDPAGNPTDGINRVQTPYAINAGQNVKSIVNWPTSQYFNIWVVESIYYAGQTGVLGYAQFPGSASWNTYGIVIRNDAFGTIGTSNADGRTLPHEVGHCLDLYHTFQGGCGSGCSYSGDYICDTPPTSGASWTCQVTTNDCTNDAGGGSPYPYGTPPMSENYMSYNSCQNIFTQDQVDVIESVFDAHYTLEQLVSQDNLEEKGVAGLVAADFESEVNVVVENEEMQFYDRTEYDATQWEWDFGASSFPPTSTDQNPSATFIETGLVPVTLVASSGSADVQTTKDVFVVSKVGDYTPRVEDFENLGSVPNNNWLTVDTDHDGITWQVTSAAAYNGDQALIIENMGDCGGATDELITSTYDLSVYNSAEIRFKAAYGQTNSGTTDFLRFSISSDYGKTWELDWVRGGTSLRSVTNFVSSNWAPSSQSEWQEFVITLPGSDMKEGMMFKFEFIADGGSALYFDDFEISGDFSGDLFLVSPEDGSTGLQKTVTLDWKAVGDVDEYEYQVDKVNTFDSGDLIEGSNDYIDATPINADTEAELTDLEPAETYYWRVRYRQNGGVSDWSDTWSFTISEDGLGLIDRGFASALNVFPNPADDLIRIESLGAELSGIQVMDLSGRVVQQLNIVGSTAVAMDVSLLTAGAYLLRISDSNGETAVKHIVIQ